MLRRGVKPDVTHVNSGSYRQSERLDGTIQVLVIERVLIVPRATAQVGYFIAHEPDTIIAMIWFDLIYRRASPGFNRWVFPVSGAHWTEAESSRSATHCVLFIGSVVIHVALVGMTLTPGSFMRDDVFRFGKICRTRILRRNQVAGLHQNSVRGYVMTVTAVVVCE
jgi:hypothetical protein